MLFWNSGGGNADIVTALQNLAYSLEGRNADTLKALQNLADGLDHLDFARFSESQVKIEIVFQNKIAKIVDRQIGSRSSRRTTLEIAESSAASKVLLIHGMKEQPTLEDFLNSPWSLAPGQQGTDNLDGGYEVWAYAVGGDATIKIGLEYQDQNDSDRSSLNTNSIMQLTPLLGTGANWDNNTGWADAYEFDLNSAISGYKAFSLSSFNPSQSYTFTINPGALDYQSVAYPINVYLFNLDSIAKSCFWRFVNGQVDLNAIRGTMLPTLKKGSWAARLPASGGEITLVPTFSRYIGLIDVRVSSETYAKTAIFNYQQGDNTGIFTLVGP